MTTREFELKALMLASLLPIVAFLPCVLMMFVCMRPVLAGQMIKLCFRTNCRLGFQHRQIRSNRYCRS